MVPVPPLALFPRPHRRGPVEALLVGGKLRHVARHFRALTGAAPLKLHRQRVRLCRFPDFRALTGAAPLKLRTLGEPCAEGGISAPSQARPR